MQTQQTLTVNQAATVIPAASMLISGLADPEFDFESLNWRPYGADQRRSITNEGENSQIRQPGRATQFRLFY